MPFSETRALAFAHYTLTALINEKKGKAKILTISRPDLAKVLDVTKLWDKHIEMIAVAAAKWEIGVANLGNRIAFVQLPEDHKEGAIEVHEARKITDKFEGVYGSKAADEMWDSGNYR